MCPNLWLAQKPSALLPVNMGSEERSFSKLKLIKTFLRSSMGQDHLPGLAIISINQETSKQLSYEDIICCDCYCKNRVLLLGIMLMCWNKVINHYIKCWIVFIVALFGWLDSLIYLFL